MLDILEYFLCCCDWNICYIIYLDCVGILFHICFEKLKLTSNKSVCAQVSTKIKAQWKINDTQIFVDEVETQLREKPIWGSQTQEFHYSEDTRH
jgi:hypothetical protein